MQSESETNKVSDSGYSNSCSNSQSQSSGSSKTRSSESNSSKSSGYGGGGGRHQSTTTSSVSATNLKPVSKRNNALKKKKLKTIGNIPVPVLESDANTSEIDNNLIIKTEKISTEADNLPCLSTQLSNNEANQINKNNEVPSNNEDNVPLLSPQLKHSTTVESTQTESANSVQLWTTVVNETKQIQSETLDECQNINAETELAGTNCSNEVKPKTAQLVSHNNAEQPSCEKQIVKMANDVEDGFYCVISMHDGLVLYTTPSLTKVLGYPQDMWFGRSFIDFVHPKDRVTFASHITTDVALALDGTTEQIKENGKKSLHVSLRKYRGLKSSGFGVLDKPVAYVPFHLSLIFRQFKSNSTVTNDLNESDDKNLYLIISASRLYSPYKVPNETCISSKFCIRHSANFEITYVDPAVANNFGFMPQNMLGRSIFEFYHPEDMLFLKEIYESVISETQIPESVIKSKPYRFLTQNGTYATIETDWSCFVNPWTKKLEFIKGHHRILRGPQNPNVFETPQENSCQISETVMKESRKIQNEIKNLLKSKLPRSYYNNKKEVTKRCKDLAIFMESLMDDMIQSKQISLELPHEFDPSFSERDSVMLGEISPHHDYYDSKSSSETPPSYNQLNYNENLQRFFESKPMTKAESDSSGGGNTDIEFEVKNNEKTPTCSNRKHLSPIRCSGDSGSGSADNSSGSNPNMESSTTSGTNVSNSNSYKPPTLTEELLVRHNEDIEKKMVKRYRELRIGNKSERECYKNKNYYKSACHAHDKNNLQTHGHGVKRSGSHSWEGDCYKQSKHQHTDQTQENNVEVQYRDHKMEPMPENNGNNLVTNSHVLEPNHNATFINKTIPTANIHLWPPFSVSVASIQNTQPSTSTSNIGNNMIPFYYITPNGQQPQEHPGPPLTYTFPYMPGVICPLIYPSPIMYPSLALLHPIPVPTTNSPTIPNVSQSTITADVSTPAITTKTSTLSVIAQEKRTVCTTATSSAITDENRTVILPASRATSVKAEPGSVLSSIASNTIANKAMSECSKNDLSTQSIYSLQSLQVFMPDEDAFENEYTVNASKIEQQIKNNKDTKLTTGSLGGDGESSYSSFYSSFLKTEASVSNDDNANSDSKTTQTKKSDDEWEKRKPQPLKRKTTPPWLEAVTVTPELIYRYQVSLKDVGDTLSTDLVYLKGMNQPILVNDQLNQLYLDLELEGLSTKLTLEEGITSSSSSGEETGVRVKKTTSSKKRRSYSMIYEEDALFPSPNK